MHPDQPATPTDTSQTTPRPRKPKLYGPGRPRALDDGKRREICALIAGGCGLSDAARYVNCSVSTIRREAERNPDFLEQLRHSEKHARLNPLRAMQQAMGTHWRAAAWFLERAFPHRFARPEPSAFGPREARRLMKEIFDLVNREVHEPFFARRVRKGVRRAFDRYIRTATDRQQNARDFRSAVKSLEAEPEPTDSIEDLVSLTQPNQFAPEQDSKADQESTAEHPFAARKEVDRLLASIGPMPPLPDDNPESSAPLIPPDCNIQ